MNWLVGKKTYLICGAALVVQALLMFNVISLETYGAIMGFLAPGGIMALRAGIAKVPPPPTP